MDLGLKDKVALVTGGGRGVGRGVCLRFAAEGAKVVVNDLHERRAERVAAEIREAGGVALPVGADITDMAQVRAMVAKAAETLGPVDILVNNAGIPSVEPGTENAGGWEDFHTSKPEAWRRIVDLNIYGTMNCTHAVLGGMVERKYGKIVSVMSEAGRVGEAKLAPYSGAKAGMLGFSKAIARELGKFSINVNVVALGAVDAKEIEFTKLDEKAQERLSKIFKSYPIAKGLQRLSRASDVADAIAFLASDRAQYITGQVLGVSGGFAMIREDAMNESSDEVLRIETRDNVLILTLNRPNAKNAFNAALSQALSAALDRFEEDPALRVGVLTGAGGSFSAGMDLKALLKGEQSSTEKRGGFGIMARPPNKPLIAAVEGYAVAGGMELALSCDLIVATTDAKFGLPEVKRGLVAVGGALFRLPRRIPYHVTMELALTGDLISAERARELGLVSQVVQPGAALEAAVALALRISQNGPLAVAATKQILAKAYEWSEENAWKEQHRLARPALRSKDATEGARAFAEKRPPVWRGE